MQLFCGKNHTPYAVTFLVRTLSYCNSELSKIPSMQNWVLLILILNAGKKRDSRVFARFRAFKIKLSKNPILHTRNFGKLRITIAQSSN